jgi:hypothetical protein
MSIYDPLRNNLLKAAAVDQQILYQFADIEKILGIPLPSSARNYRQWWENQADTSNRPQADAWKTAGFEVAKVDLVNETVTFKRI